MVGEEHLAIELVEVGRGFHGFEGGMRHGEKTGTDGFGLFDERGGGVLIVFAEGGLGLAVEGG